MRLHVDDLGCNAGGPQDRNGPPGSLDARIVRIVGQQHLVHIALQKTRLIFRQGGAQGGHRTLKAGLVHGNHIHIALAEDHIGLPGLPGEIQPEEIPGFVEKLGFR